tara:strand:+ start:358 stop:516 length:159 start_codon:yes stop_codon:yes gene_type:complete
MGKEKMEPESHPEEEQLVSGMIGLGNEGFGKERSRERELQRMLGEFEDMKKK